jgi:F0F1-type ATP synthase assembly protein I
VARVLAPLSAGFAYDHIGHSVPFFAAGMIVLFTIPLGLGMEKFVKQPYAVETPSAA